MRAIATALVLGLTAAGCAPTASNPEIRANPHNELSCWVSWTTSTPTPSRVDFGADGQLPYYVEDPEEVTEHEILVFGMRPDTTYELRVSATGDPADDDVEQAPTFTTSVPPFHDLLVEVDVLDLERMERGWTLTNILVDEVLYPATAVIFDAEGYPVWYHQHGGDESRADIEVRLVDGDRVLFGGSLEPGLTVAEVDLGGETVWEGPEQPNDWDPAPDDAYHHSFRKLDDGTYLGLKYEWVGNQLFDVVHQFDAGGDTVWSWQGTDLPHSDSDVYPWGNAALVDLDDDAAYYNTRGNNAVYKIDRATGEVLWVLGDGGDFARDQDHARPWFAEAHSPELLSGGNILMYDNGTADRGQSRAVEYALDEQAMTAEIVWEYPGSGVHDEWYTVHMGDADRLANGNTLINVGHMVAGGSQSRIMEVAPSGDVVWQMWFAGEEHRPAGGFSAERIPVLVGRN